MQNVGLKSLLATAVLHHESRGKKPKDLATYDGKRVLCRTHCSGGVFFGYYTVTQQDETFSFSMTVKSVMETLCCI